MSVIASNDAWAVGTARNQDTGQDWTLAEHWTGSAWEAIHTPNRGHGWFENGLLDVLGLSTDDVWAVGYSYGFPYSLDKTLVEHWDGSRWNIVPSPNAGPQDNVLASISGTGTGDLWAVGRTYNTQGGTFDVAEHWNGATWQLMDEGLPWPDSGLLDVSADAPGDVWAISQNDVVRWNGSAWTRVRTAACGSGFCSITALAPDDVWLIGSYSTGHLNREKYWPVAWHWDGSGWTSVPMPHPYLMRDTEVNDVFAAGPNDIWAAGAFSKRYYGVPSPRRTLIEHWNGSAWSISKPPDPDSQFDYFFGIDGQTGTDDLWAVGQLTSGTLIEHRTPG